MNKFVFGILMLGMLTGCSSGPSKPETKAEPAAPKGPELVTGLTGFHRGYLSARRWAADAQPYKLESQLTKDSKGLDGKAAVWRTGFASPAQKGVKPITWSGSADKDAPSAGISPGPEDNYSPTNSSTRVFDASFLKVDSDKAFDTAQKHGGDKFLAKNPDTPVIYLLEWNRDANMPVWHVIYGNSRDDAKFRVMVNASTGDFIRVEK